MTKQVFPLLTSIIIKVRESIYIPLVVKKKKYIMTIFKKLYLKKNKKKFFEKLVIKNLKHESVFSFTNIFFLNMYNERKEAR